MREDYQPFNIGKRFVITPPDITPSNQERLNLVMQRGAFGSGEHETTQSCIEILETLPLEQNLKILDLGSGTAILTIAARLLNPTGRAWCVDIDADEGQRFETIPKLRDNATPERLILRDEIGRVIFQTIEELPDDLRTAITLRELDGLSYEEIAEVMNCPIGTVRSRIFRAREAIDSKLKPLLSAE